MRGAAVVQKTKQIGTSGFARWNLDVVRGIAEWHDHFFRFCLLIQAVRVGHVVSVHLRKLRRRLRNAKAIRRASHTTTAVVLIHSLESSHPILPVSIVRGHPTPGLKPESI